MKKTLTVIGNSLGIIIDKPILELLDIGKDTVLEVTTDGQGLFIRPVREPGAPTALSPRFSSAAPARSASSASPDEPQSTARKSKPALASALSSGQRVSEPLPSQTTEIAAAECVVELKGEVVDRVSLVGKQELVVGRDSAADIALDDRALSRRHARIERRGAALWLIDLGSANGTLVNGARVTEPHRIARGDIITVGRYHLRIEGVQQARSDTPMLTLRGPEGTHRFALVGDRIVIGRSESCDIAIGHKSISRRHLRLSVGDEGVSVEDLKSQNGTKVNGKRIHAPTAVTAADTITMGGFTLVIDRLAEVRASDDPSTATHGSMLIDSHDSARTAYVGGNFEQVMSSAVGVALGSQVERDGDRSGEDPEPSRS